MLLSSDVSLDRSRPFCVCHHHLSLPSFILGLQPIPGDPKDNGVAAMLDDRTFCFVIQHGRHAIVFLDLQGLVANQEYDHFFHG